MKITIDNQIKTITPKFNIGVITGEVVVKENNQLSSIVDSIEKEISSSIEIKEVVNLNIIKQARDAYKAYGKDPSRYRLAVESLYRRLAKGNKLYRINNVVDIGNILSIKTRKSTAVLDSKMIKGNILIRLGNELDDYYGIGRGKINVQNIPVYQDDLGPFGSTTSDTERTMITRETTHVLIFIISFTGQDDLHKDINEAISLYEAYADGTNFRSKII